VPIIIPKERFDAIGVTRNKKSPKQKPPLYVTPKSLLTGLCRCGTCGGAMSIATGKGGRYRYLKCCNRNSIDNDACESPNLPLEKFEKLVLETVIENVLTEERIAMILSDCRDNIDQFSQNSTQERKQLIDLQSDCQRRLTKLYQIVEESDGDPAAAFKDQSLSQRIRHWQDRLTEVKVQLSELKVSVALSPNLFEGIDVPAFSSKMRSVMMDPKSEEAAGFLRLFVSEIKVYADTASMSGPNLGVLETVIAERKDTAAVVPSFMSNWRRGRDSNPR
jgi:site-specific DNA recombinase